MAAAACKEGMNGHMFNGRACVVAFASPNTVRRMGEAQVSKSQAMTQAQTPHLRVGAEEAGNRFIITTTLCGPATKRQKNKPTKDRNKKPTK
ncbi:unnamed protein product [Spirodela intermedia]|uniref:Uncharacterized protein n=1 Tax=Spirodela intermedia TaxID=51605 RepID=A0ABN7EAI5_SPIIN|nr:unnamed protein product [Spirodela intermedia]